LLTLIREPKERAGVLIREERGHAHEKEQEKWWDIEGVTGKSVG